MTSYKYSTDILTIQNPAWKSINGEGWRVVRIDISRKGVPAGHRFIMFNEMLHKQSLAKYQQSFISWLSSLETTYALTSSELESLYKEQTGADIFKRYRSIQPSSATT